MKFVYKVTGRLPDHEKFGLASEMRRVAASIPSNIAEGQARHTTRAFVQFVSNAEGSLAELDIQLILCVELEYCSKPDVSSAFELITELRKMLNSLRRKLVERSG